MGPRKPTESELAMLTKMNAKLVEARTQIQNMDGMFVSAFEALREECGASKEHTLDANNEWVAPEAPEGKEE